METKKQHLFIILISTFVLISCNRNTLHKIDVEPKRQRSSQWCWAACMEMVMGYHHKQNSQYTALNQCELAVDWLEYNRTVTETPFDTRSCCLSDCNIMPRCGQRINSLNNIVSYYELLNYSKPFLKPFAENEIKKQIDDNRIPFITSINYTANAVLGCVDDHVIVATGYEYTDVGFTIFGIDPYVSCNDSIRLVKYPHIPDPNDAEKICSYIWNIFPNGASTRLTRGGRAILNSFNSSPITSTVFSASMVDTSGTSVSNVVLKYPKISASIGSFFSKLFHQKDKFQGEQLKSLTNQQFAELVGDKNYSIVPVKYINFSQLAIARGAFKTNDVETKNLQVIEVIYNKSNPPTINRFQKGVEKWKTIVAIKQSDDLKLFRKNDNINWKENIKKEYWKQANTIADDSYEKILVPPFNYEFYKHKSAGTFKYIPVSDYQDLTINGNSLKKGQSYDETSVLKILQSKAIEYLQTKK